MEHTMNRAATKMGIQESLWYVDLESPLGICPGRVQLGHMVMLFLVC